MGIYLLRSLALFGIVRSSIHMKPSRRHGIFLLIISGLIMIDRCKEHKHTELTSFLQSHRTPLSSNFSYSKWRSYSMPKFQHLVTHHPAIAVRMIQFIFYERPLCEISRRNVAVGLRAVLTAHLVHEQLETFEADVKLIEDMISPLGTFSATKTSLQFIRPNNEITNHGPLTPLYYPLLVAVPRHFIRIASNLFLAHAQQYHRRTCPDTNLTFWSRTTDVTAPTLVFFHGIGLGVIP
jgi:hypothetical protein